jgi:hypothetical protein
MPLPLLPTHVAWHLTRLASWCVRRPIELPSGWPVSCYPLVVQPMMQLYERLFGPRKLL